MKILGLNITRDKPVEKRSLDYSPFLSTSLGFGRGYNSASSMNLSAVNCAVNLISDSIATLPIQVYGDDGKGGKTQLTSHPLYNIFTSLYQTRYNLIKSIVQSVLLKGNGYALIERKGKQVVGLKFIPSEDVQIVYRKETGELYYTCTYIGGQIQPSDILHFYRYSFDGVQGISVLSNAARSLNIANQTENTAETFFSTGCNLNGVLKVHSNLSQEQRQDIANSWRSTFGQGNSSSGVAVLPVGMDYQSISINGSDAQMLESREFSVVDIARFFNISPVLLGDLSKGGYSTIEDANLQFLSYTLNPYINMVEDELNRKIGGSGIELGLDETAILRTNKSQQASYYNSLLQMGVLSINEVRHELGYSPVDGGDSHNLAYNDVSKTNLTDNTEDEKQE